MTEVIKQLQSVLPAIKEKMKSAGMDVQAIEREASFALQAIANNPQLAECDPSSVGAAIVNIANIGLTLNPAANEAAIVPRWVRGQGKIATLQPMYQGLAVLAMREGIVTQIVTQLVYQKDDITVDLADNLRPVIHKTNPFGDRGSIVGAYAVATDRYGNRQAEVMTIENIEFIRDMSDGYKAYAAGKIKAHPWVDHFGEMARKTVLKRLVKYLNKKGGSDSRLAAAVALDNEDYGAERWQIAKIERLLETSSLDHEQRATIEREFLTYNRDEANRCIDYLQGEQLPDTPQYNGGGYSSRPAKKVKQAVQDAVKNEKT